MSSQIAWCGRDKVTHADGGPIVGKSLSQADGTQLMNAVDDSDMSSDDELFGLLGKSAADRRVSNGAGAGGSGHSVTAGDMSHAGVQQYVGGNMSSMLSGISISQSTPVQ